MQTPTNPPPSRLTRTAETVHLLSLTLWLSVVLMSGVVAAVVFPLMRDLQPTLGAYPQFTGDHANLAAGRVAAKIFLIADTAAFLSASLALITLILMIVKGTISNRRLSHGIRVVAMSVAITTLSYHLLLLAPRMDASLKTYWAAAQAGDNEAANAARLAFAMEHPKARRSLGLLAFSVSVCLISGLWSVQVPHTPTTLRTHTPRRRKSGSSS